MNLNEISRLLIEEGLITGQLEVVRPVGGGCINECFQVRSGSEHYFLKVNSASAFPGMFAREAEGLDLLRRAAALDVPQVFFQAEIGGTAFLLMEYIATSRPGLTYWEDCGLLLARMHRRTAAQFGLDRDNFIGSLVQYNDWKPSWAEFYLDRRLIPQLEMGVRAGWASASHFSAAESVARVIEEEFPGEPSALLHGDLWGGNLLTGPKGQAVLVDPAVYYGNREMEITFTRLFGGFHPAFYDRYDSEWPLQPDARSRMPIHNLYPLMVHANLFGGHYVEEVVRILAKHG